MLQEQDGYLTEDGMEHVGELLGLTAAEVRGTATFYDMFHLEPVGRTWSRCAPTSPACCRAPTAAGARRGAARGGAGGTTDGRDVHPGGRRVPGPVRQRPVRDGQLAVLRRRRPRSGSTPLIDDLRAGRLDDEVPPHGTLNRVPRDRGSGRRRRRAGGSRAEPGRHAPAPPARPAPTAGARSPPVDLDDPPDHRRRWPSLDAGHPTRHGAAP